MLIKGHLRHVLQGSTLTVAQLPGASNISIRASETLDRLVRSGKKKD